MTPLWIDPYIHSFIFTTIHRALPLHRVLCWFVGGESWENQDSVCFAFSYPGDFSTFLEDYFLGFQLYCDVLIFADETIKG